MSELIYSSAVLTLSQTTEFMRNKSIDNTILHLIVQKGGKEFSIQQAYDLIHDDLPIRKEEIQKSLLRSYNNKVINLQSGEIEKPKAVVFELPESKSRCFIESLKTWILTLTRIHYCEISFHCYDMFV